MNWYFERQYLFFRRRQLRSFDGSSVRIKGDLYLSIRAPFGQHQESRPLARSNTESPRFVDFPSLCACSEFVFTKPFKNGMSLDRARSRDSWCWPKGARPLGTRMVLVSLGEFLTREAHAQHELSWVVDKCVTRSMGCKLYANEVRSQLTFQLLSIFTWNKLF